jgi:hypothetical protein
MSWQAKRGLSAQISKILRAAIARSSTSVWHSALAVRARSDEKMPISPIMSPGPSTMSISSSRISPLVMMNMSSEGSPTRNRCWPCGTVRGVMKGTSQSAAYALCWRASLNAMDTAGGGASLRASRTSARSSTARIRATSRTMAWRAASTGIWAHSAPANPATASATITGRRGSRLGRWSSRVRPTGTRARLSSIQDMGAVRSWGRETAI